MNFIRILLKNQLSFEQKSGTLPEFLWKTQGFVEKLKKFGEKLKDLPIKLNKFEKYSIFGKFIYSGSLKYAEKKPELAPLHIGAKSAIW